MEAYLNKSFNFTFILELSKFDFHFYAKKHRYNKKNCFKANPSNKKKYFVDKSNGFMNENKIEENMVNYKLSYF